MMDFARGAYHVILFIVLIKSVRAGRWNMGRGGGGEVESSGGGNNNYGNADSHHHHHYHYESSGRGIFSDIYALLLPAALLVYIFMLWGNSSGRNAGGGRNSVASNGTTSSSSSSGRGTSSGGGGGTGGGGGGSSAAARADTAHVLRYVALFFGVLATMVVFVQLARAYGMIVAIWAVDALVVVVLAAAWAWDDGVAVGWWDTVVAALRDNRLLLVLFTALRAGPPPLRLMQTIDGGVRFGVWTAVTYSANAAVLWLVPLPALGRLLYLPWVLLWLHQLQVLSLGTVLSTVRAGLAGRGFGAARMDVDEGPADTDGNAVAAAANSAVAAAAAANSGAMMHALLAANRRAAASDRRAVATEKARRELEQVWCELERDAKAEVESADRRAEAFQLRAVAAEAAQRRAERHARVANLCPAALAKPAAAMEGVLKSPPRRRGSKAAHALPPLPPSPPSPKTLRAANVTTSGGAGGGASDLLGLNFANADAGGGGDSDGGSSFGGDASFGGGANAKRPRAAAAAAGANADVASNEGGGGGMSVGGGGGTTGHPFRTPSRNPREQPALRTTPPPIASPTKEPPAKKQRGVLSHQMHLDGGAFSVIGGGVERETPFSAEEAFAL